ncbi:MAG: hypothetical protein P0121_10755 [Nitrospira sp.]|nr:hypothetical protein [Nitrospira sp.]
MKEVTTIAKDEMLAARAKSQKECQVALAAHASGRIRSAGV